MNRSVRPALAILDAVTAMEGAGPASGNPRQVGALLASRDLAAVDTLACHLIGLAPLRVALRSAARGEGFGETRLEQMHVCGPDWRRLAVADFKNVAQPADVLRLLPLPKPALLWLRRQWTALPQILDGRCTRCGICEKGCPVKPAAIHPRSASGRKLDEAQCIRCYCCHEFCPSHAIELRAPWLARHLPLERLANGVSRAVGFVSARKRPR